MGDQDTFVVAATPTEGKNGPQMYATHTLDCLTGHFQLMVEASVRNRRQYGVKDLFPG